MDGCPLLKRHISIGNLAQEILKLADKEKVDMVVMAAMVGKAIFYSKVLLKKLWKILLFL